MITSIWVTYFPMINLTYKISSWFYKEQVVKEVLNINLFFIKSWGKERKYNLIPILLSLWQTQKKRFLCSEIYKKKYFHYTFRYTRLQNNIQLTLLLFSCIASSFSFLKILYLIKITVLFFSTTTIHLKQL